MKNPYTDPSLSHQHRVRHILITVMTINFFVILIIMYLYKYNPIVAWTTFPILNLFVFAVIISLFLCSDDTWELIKWQGLTIIFGSTGSVFLVYFLVEKQFFGDVYIPFSSISPVIIITILINLPVFFLTLYKMSNTPTILVEIGN